VPKALRAENNQVLNRLFYNLGTAITTRHEAKQWRKARLAEQRAAILASAMETVDFYWRVAPWVALVTVVMVGGAFALRWINKGVLF
jgi:fatty acid desaturase